MNKIMRPKKVPQKWICVYVCMCAEKRKVYCNNSKNNNNRKTWAKILETLKSTHAFQHMTIKSFTKRVETIQPEKLERTNARTFLEQIEDKILPFNSFQWVRRQWHSTPGVLPGKSHGRRSLVGYSPWCRYSWAITLAHSACELLRTEDIFQSLNWAQGMCSNIIL